MKSIGTLSDVAGNRATDPDAPQTERQRIEALEKRVATLELLLNDVMHHIDNPKKTETKTSASTPERKTKTTPKPPSKPKSNPKQKTTPKQKPKPKSPKQKTPQPWDDPQRLAEISALADRILAETSLASLTKAETVSRFAVDSKLAGQTLAWLVMKGKMSMLSPEPTQDDPDPKKTFRLK